MDRRLIIILIFIPNDKKSSRNEVFASHTKALSLGPTRMGPTSPHESSKAAETQKKRHRGHANKLILRNIEYDEPRNKKIPLGQQIIKNFKESMMTKDSDADKRTMVSPNSSIMSKLSKRLKNRFVNGHLQTQGVYSPTKISDMPFMFKTYNTNEQICEFDEDFKDLRAAEKKFKRRIVPLINLKDLDYEDRENLICKIKKICDTFELGDETFYTSVMLNDFQMMSNQKVPYDPITLEKLFDFSQLSDGTDKMNRYISFFKCIACIIISIKFCEHEKETPYTKEILEFFELEGLTPILIMKDKDDKPTEKKTIKALFKYIFDQQISILLMIDFKINPVSLKHFIDHYCLILPQPEERVSETETSQVSSIFEDKKCMMTEAFNKSIKGIRKREQTAMIKEINDEIKECINSISNLSPLLPDFCCCHFSEISIASLCVTVSFSFKCLAAKNPDKIKKFTKLKELYVKWIENISEKYNMNNKRVYQYNLKMKEFLKKVNDGS
ncbi:unnamed protein product [Moneuplotes crassus]|uniref:Uncharacterized protein n=1 Tax=Euplotes crassus TaxID=5936 RepID=A0AAD2D9S5_EUPCR|nr:unnamed protein product [Moneuplotes crassus]